VSSNAFHQLYYHFVWSTKGRLPEIKDTLIQYAEFVISEDAKKRHGFVLACGVMPEHVHLLVSLPPDLAPSAFIGQVRGATAYEMNKTIGEKAITWQVGYGVLSMRKGDLDRVTKYVCNQPAIHAARTKPSILEYCGDE
jgi:putative transposase